MKLRSKTPRSRRPITTASDGEQEAHAVAVSVRHLRLFEAVARLRSVRQASEECHLSQPAVTQAVAKLERQVGAPLLERRASGTYLNADGLIFHRRVCRLLTQVEDALRELGVDALGVSLATVANRITLSQIRSLSSIVENGSLTGAARALESSQVSLVRAARLLQRNLKRPLYQRTADGLMATPAGAEFVRKVKLAFREIDLAIEELAEAHGRSGSQIVIGAMPIAGSDLLGLVLQEFMTTHPGARVRIVTGDANDMLKNLRLGSVDFVIGLLRERTPPDLHNEPLADTEYVVAARHGHPLTRKRSASLDDVSAYEWIVGPPGAPRRRCFDSVFAGRPTPHYAIETSSLPILRQMLAQSDRLALLTRLEVSCEKQWFAIAPFEPIATVPSIGVISRAGWLATPMQAAFIALFRARIVGFLHPHGRQEKVG